VFVSVRLTLVLTVKVLVGPVRVGERRMVVDVRVEPAQMLEPPMVSVVVVGHVEVGVVVDHPFVAVFVGTRKVVFGHVRSSPHLAAGRSDHGPT
jgi:hypothetical protein